MPNKPYCTRKLSILLHGRLLHHSLLITANSAYSYFVRIFPVYRQKVCYKRNVHQADKMAQFKKDWDTLKKFKNPLDGSDDDVRKLRRRVNLQFWEVFERAVLKYLKKRSDLPKYMRLFFDLVLAYSRTK